MSSKINLTSPSQVKAWCIANGFHPNRVLGQNFLIDRNALEAIVDAGLAGNAGRSPETAGPAADGCKAPSVLEIGPGLGVLTEEMLRRGCRVTAIEKDPVLAARLERESKSRDEEWWGGLTVIAGDAIDILRPSATALPLPTFDCMISNLPYQAGTRILLELVTAREPPSMTVLVQTEVAERLAAGPGSKTRGLSGVWTQLDYDVRIVRRVAANCFWPRPEIGSSVVRLDRHDRNASLPEKERTLFYRLTKQAFEHRRKQLGSIFRDMIQSTARAEELSNENWIELVKGLTA